MGMTKEELIEEIEDIYYYLDQRKPEYAAETTTDPEELEDCSVSKLYQTRKLCQIYLHEYSTIRKEEINCELTKIDEAIRALKTPNRVFELIKILNNDTYRDSECDNIYEYNLYLSHLTGFLSAIDQLKRDGLLKGDYSIKFNLSAVQTPNEEIPLLKQKREYLREVQTMDRLLQKHMKKPAKCIPGDAYYEKQLKSIDARLTELKGIEKCFDKNMAVKEEKVI